MMLCYHSDDTVTMVMMLCYHGDAVQTRTQDESNEGILVPTSCPGRQDFFHDHKRIDERE